MTTAKPTIITVNSNKGGLGSTPGEVTLRDAIIQTQATEGGSYDIIFEIPENAKPANTLGTSYFTIALNKPLPNIYRNKVTINPDDRPFHSVILIPSSAAQSPTDQAKPLESNINGGNPSGSMLYIGDINAVHYNYRNSVYSGDAPEVSINGFNFVKNISKGGDGQKGAGGAVGVGGAITLTKGNLKISNAVFQDLHAVGGIGANPAKGGEILAKLYLDAINYLGMHNADFLLAERGGRATSPSVPYRKGTKTGGSTDLEYTNIYNPISPPAGIGGGYQAICGTKHKPCQIMRFGGAQYHRADIWFSSTGKRSFQEPLEYDKSGTFYNQSHQGQNVTQKPNTFSNIYGGGGAGGSGGGAPGFYPAGKRDVRYGPTNADLRKFGGSATYIGQGGPGGETTSLGGGKGGRGNNGWARDYTKEEELDRYTKYQQGTINGGTRGEDGEGRGGAIAILNRGMDTSLTLKNVDFFKTESKSSKAKQGHVIYSEKNSNNQPTNIYLNNVYLGNSNTIYGQTRKSLVTINDAFISGQTNFYGGNYEEVKSSSQVRDIPFYYGVSSPKNIKVADLRNQVLKGKPNIADQFYITVESANGSVGVTSNFNDPNNPFNQMWKKITPDKSEQLQNDLAEAISKKAAAMRTNFWDPVKDKFGGIAMGFVGQYLGSYCLPTVWGGDPNEVKKVKTRGISAGCMAVGEELKGMISGDSTNAYVDYDATINSLKEGIAKNDDEQKKLQDYLADKSNTKIGQIDLTQQRAPVVIKDFELGIDTISIPLANGDDSLISMDLTSEGDLE